MIRRALARAQGATSRCALECIDATKLHLRRVGVNRNPGYRRIGCGGSANARYGRADCIAGLTPPERSLEFGPGALPRQMPND